MVVISTQHILHKHNAFMIILESNCIMIVFYDMAIDICSIKTSLEMLNHCNKNSM